MPDDPEWLTKARSEGRILSETWAGAPPASAPSATPAHVPAEDRVALPRPEPAAVTIRTDSVRLVIELDVPIRLVSEANTGGKLGAKIGRKSKVKAAVKAALPKLAEPIPLPVVVTITRLGGKQLDADDNLPRACKPVKDVLAEFLGVQDTGRDPRVRWKFQQRPAYSAGCRIRVEFRGG